MTAIAAPCSDRRCTDGVTWCAECNGHGVLRPGGKKYRVNGAGNITAYAVEHAECHGTGLLPCGCRPLSADVLAVLG